MKVSAASHYKTRPIHRDLIYEARVSILERCRLASKALHCQDR
jgi:hypothetical protein